MKVKNFSSFMKTRKTNENSDLDWSDKNWDERGQDAENPPNNGLEGSSAFQPDFYSGNYGDSDEEDEIFVDDPDRNHKSDDDINSIKAHIDDLTRRIESIESKIKYRT